MTLIRSLGSCSFHWCSLLIGTLITTMAGYEKGLLDESKLNTRYRDKSSDKMPRIAWGNHLPIKFYSSWSYKQLIRLGNLMSGIILLTVGKCGLTGVKQDTTLRLTTSYHELQKMTVSFWCFVAWQHGLLGANIKLTGDWEYYG